MKNTLKHLFTYKTLSEEQAYNALVQIAEGAYNDCEIAAFLTTYNMRSITVNELIGFRDALLDLCLKIDLSDYNTIDLCGTGGDGKNTFNISTLTSFVVAGAGEKVAKHGNYGVSSACGSSNVMEYLGYNFSNDASKLRKSIDKAGICFLHAPLFHPAMKNVAPVRRKLGVKTFFNMLGPMVNPSFPKNQMVGVFSLELARLYNYLYQHNNKNYVVLHSLSGYDEISLTDKVKVIANNREELLSPEYLGFETLTAEQLFGGNTVPEAAKIFTTILQGGGTNAQNSVVIANAAMALHCLHPQVSYADCKARAAESLLSKKALGCFTQSVTINA